MFVNYTKNLYKNLIQQDFKPMILNKDDSITEDTYFVSLINFSGEIVYIVNILNCEKYEPDECMSELFLSKSTILQKYEKVNIIFLNIFVTRDNKKIKAYIDKIDKNFLLTYKEIFWGVEVNEENKISLYSDPCQPTKFLGIEKHILNNENSADFSSNSKDSISNLARKAFLEDPLRPKPILFHTYKLIIIVNVLIFTIVATNGGLTTNNLLSFGAFSYDSIIYFHQYYRLITSIFLHGSILHLVSNMLALYIFGKRLEETTSSATFLSIYFISGIGANALMLLFPSNAVMIGASGCIFGIIGATLVLTSYFKKSIDRLNSTGIFTIAIINLAISLVDPQITFSVHFFGFIIGIILGIIYTLHIIKK